MTATLNLGPILSFLGELSQNNNKAWFEQHRPDYQSTRSIFEQFINGIIDEFRLSNHLEGLSARDCIARIYRYIRFSKDKSPYKTNLAAIVAPGGWKVTSFGYYISIQPRGQSIVAGGLHDPTPEQLVRFRQAIDRDAAALKKITRARLFIETFRAIEGDRLKTSPKGYDRTHPEIALLQLKQITAVHPFTDQEVLADDFAVQVVRACHAMEPFLNYLSDIVQQAG